MKIGDDAGSRQNKMGKKVWGMDLNGRRVEVGGWRYCERRKM
jgi:hypothetical protein